MSLEQEIRDIIGEIHHHEGWGKLGQKAAEAHVNRQIEGIWSALLLIARRVDADHR